MRLSPVVWLVLLCASPALAQPTPDAYAAQSQSERTAAYQKARADYDLQVRVLNFAAGCKVIGEQDAGPPTAAAEAALLRDGKRLGMSDDLDALTSTAREAGLKRAAQPNACHYWHDHPDAVAFVQAHVTHAPK